MAGSVQASPGVNVTPAPSQVALPTNYIKDFSFINQYLPDVHEEEFARYGERSVASFLRLVSAEKPSDSDLIKWSEDGRLHTIYSDCTTVTADAASSSVFVVGGGTCTFRVNQTVIVNDGTSEAKGIITALPAADSFTVAWYEATGQPVGFQAAGAITAFVYGSEFKKGSAGMQGSLEAESEIFQNKPIIIKDLYEVSGSDMAQVGWIKVDGEGYYWFMKSNHETRKRFDDYLEMSMIEAVPAENGTDAESFLSDNTGGNNAGTEGLFYTVGNRGNVYGGGIPTAVSDWDNILKRLDKQGAIEENVIFDNRDMSLAIDDMLAAQNSYGAGGTSYGLFDNDKDMALNLGFKGFHRGGYEFYQTDWKYLNQATLRGGLTGANVNAVLVPTGSTTIYDQVLGKKTSVPFLHVKYRVSNHINRNYRTWMTGGASGNQTDDVDAMYVNYLSERALCTMGANNFFLFQD